MTKHACAARRQQPETGTPFSSPDAELLPVAAIHPAPTWSEFGDTGCCSFC